MLEDIYVIARYVFEQGFDTSFLRVYADQLEDWGMPKLANVFHVAGGYGGDKKAAKWTVQAKFAY